MDSSVSPERRNLVPARVPSYFKRSLRWTCYIHHLPFTRNWLVKSLSDVLLTVHLSIFILVINKVDAQNCCFTINLVYSSTCFEHHVLIIRRSNLYYTASVIITPVDGRPVHRLGEDCAPDGHLQVWWYQMLCNTILTSWWSAHGARNI